MATSKRRKRLTPKQNRLVKAVVLHPNATLDELGKESGYNNGASVHRALKNSGIQARVSELMDAHPQLKMGRLLNKLAAGLESKKERVSISGKVVGTSPDMGTRHRYLETAFRLNGALRQEADASGAGTRMALAVILLGQREARGLPLVSA